MQVTERYAKESAREYAFRILKTNIIMLELEPGSLVSENELSIELGVSRTPVREALIELSKSQIVEIYPQKGSYISKIDYALVEEAHFMRLVLEKAIIELVCDTALPEDLLALEQNVKLQEFYLENPSPNKLLELDNEFHKEFFAIGKKMQTYQLMNSMTAHFDRMRSLTLKSIKDIKIVEDHRKILEAVKQKRKEEAIQLIIKHLSRYMVDEEEIQVREQYSQYFK